MFRTRYSCDTILLNLTHLPMSTVVGAKPSQISVLVDLNYTNQTTLFWSGSMMQWGAVNCWHNSCWPELGFSIHTMPVFWRNPFSFISKCLGLVRLGINAEQIWVTLFRLYANLVTQSVIIEIRMCLCVVRAGLAISLLSRVVENTQLEFNIL